MKIAVLSGKGGAGKTLVSVNLAAAARAATYVDCDVEEPNGRIFLKPAEVTEAPVNVLLPAFDAERCTGCRTCVDFCRFNALVYIMDKPMLFTEVCHSCGGCMLLCPEQAVSEEAKQIGRVEQGMHGDIRVITGEMNLGEASGVPVVREAIRISLEAHAAQGADAVTIIDCPPGSSCLAMESIADADYCLMVVEPTAFGVHNFLMVHELAQLLGKRCGVVVNKADEAPYEPLERYCADNDLPILMRIPYRADYAKLAAGGKILVEEDAEAAALFEGLLRDVAARVLPLSCEEVLA